MEEAGETLPCPPGTTPKNAAIHGAETQEQGLLAPNMSLCEVSTGHRGGNPSSSPQYLQSAYLVLGTGLSGGVRVNKGIPPQPPGAPALEKASDMTMTIAGRKR